MFALEKTAMRKELVGYCILDLRTAQMNGTKVSIFCTKLNQSDSIITLNHFA